MATITCANHTVFTSENGRDFTCMSCNLPPRPAPPKPDDVAAAEAEAADVEGHEITPIVARDERSGAKAKGGRKRG